MRVFGEFHVGTPLKEIGWSGKGYSINAFPALYVDPGYGMGDS